MISFAMADYKTYFTNLQSIYTFDVLSLESPFEDTQNQLYLQALFPKKAKINGKWYKQGDVISKNLRLEAIKSDFVMIKEDEYSFKLSLKRINHKILIP